MFDPIEKILGRKLVKRDWFSRNAMSTMAPAMGGGSSSGGSSAPTTISHVDAQGHPYTISYTAPVHATPQPTHISNISQQSSNQPLSTTTIRSIAPSFARSVTAQELRPVNTGLPKILEAVQMIKPVQLTVPNTNIPASSGFFNKYLSSIRPQELMQAVRTPTKLTIPTTTMPMSEGYFDKYMAAVQPISGYNQANIIASGSKAFGAVPSVLVPIAKSNIGTLEYNRPSTLVVPGDNMSLTIGKYPTPSVPGTTIPMSKGFASKVSEFTGQRTLTPLQSRGMVVVSKGQAEIQPSAPMLNKGVMGDVLSVAGLRSLPNLPIQTIAPTTPVNMNIVRAQLGTLGQQLVNEGLLSPSGQVLSNRTRYR